MFTDWASALYARQRHWRAYPSAVSSLNASPGGCSSWVWPLLRRPGLLILDEATEGLAPLIVAEIWRVIAAIRETGIATLIVDRDWRRVLRHTDQALVMEKGQIVLAGDSERLLEDPHALNERLGV